MTTLQRSIALDRPVDASEAAALASAFGACREIARARARNFYYGLCLTPEPKRSAIFSVYAWMRRADDEADAAAHDAPNPADRLSRLADLRRTLLRIQSGEFERERQERPRPRKEPGVDPVCLALTHTLRTYPIDTADLHAMLDGLEEDARHSGYETRDDLEQYCYRVASTVGLICLAVWGLREGVDREEARRLGVRRGIAFQLTNILRDFAQDFDDAPPRVYLPREDFQRFGLTPDDLRAWSKPQACEAMVRDVASWARSEYEASAPLDGLIVPSCQPTLWAMTRIYAGLLAKIEARPSRVVSERRIRLQSAHKAGIAALAVVRARRDRWR